MNEETGEIDSRLCSSSLSCGGQPLLPDAALGRNAHRVIDHFPPAKNITALGQWEKEGFRLSAQCCLQGNRSHTSKVVRGQAAIFVNRCPAFDQKSRTLQGLTTSHRAGQCEGVFDSPRGGGVLTLSSRLARAPLRYWRMLWTPRLTTSGGGNVMGQ